MPDEGLGACAAHQPLATPSGGAAAACFTFLVVLQEPSAKQEARAPMASLVQEKQYVEMSLNAPKSADTAMPDRIIFTGLTPLWYAKA